MKRFHRQHPVRGLPERSAHRPTTAARRSTSASTSRPRRDAGLRGRVRHGRTSTRPRRSTSSRLTARTVRLLAHRPGRQERTRRAHAPADRPDRKAWAHVHFAERSTASTSIRSATAASARTPTARGPRSTAIARDGSGLVAVARRHADLLVPAPGRTAGDAGARPLAPGPADAWQTTRSTSARDASASAFCGVLPPATRQNHKGEAGLLPASTSRASSTGGERPLRGRGRRQRRRPATARSCRFTRSARRSERSAAGRAGRRLPAPGSKATGVPATTAPRSGSASHRPWPCRLCVTQALDRPPSPSAPGASTPASRRGARPPRTRAPRRLTMLQTIVSFVPLADEHGEPREAHALRARFAAEPPVAASISRPVPADRAAAAAAAAGRSRYESITIIAVGRSSGWCEASVRDAEPEYETPTAGARRRRTRCTLAIPAARLARDARDAPVEQPPSQAGAGVAVPVVAAADERVAGSPRERPRAGGVRPGRIVMAIKPRRERSAG